MPIGTESICPYCGYENYKNGHVAESVLPPGTILSRRYLIGSVLGQGGFGITYIGRDLTLDMRVAIKEYYPVGYVNRNNTASLNVSEAGEKQAEFLKKGKTR